MGLSENLHALRKERGLTQEQLAEAMRVSSAAVSKWECGLSTPDVALVMALADYFEVSVDALLGYACRNQSRQDALTQVTALADAKRYDEAVPAARELMRRYPNDFRVLHECARTLGFTGLERHDTALLREALTLTERTLPLLRQNDNPDITRETILGQQGMYHASLEEYEAAAQCYRAGNIGGIYDVELGQCLSNMKRFDEAIAQLSLGWMRGLSDLINGTLAMVSCLSDTDRAPEALDLCRWMTGLLDGLAVTPGSYAYKFGALGYAVQAMLHQKLTHPSEVTSCLTQAAALAARFDEAPDYTTAGFRFYGGKPYTMADDSALTALDAVRTVLMQEDDPAARESLARQLDEVLAQSPNPIDKRSADPS